MAEELGGSDLLTSNQSFFLKLILISLRARNTLLSIVAYVELFALDKMLPTYSFKLFRSVCPDFDINYRGNVSLAKLLIEVLVVVRTLL